MDENGKNRLVCILKSGIAKHAYAWLFLFVLMILEDPLNPLHYWKYLRYILFTMLPVYLHFYVMDRYLFKKKYLLYILFLILIIIITGTIDLSIFQDTEKPRKTLSVMFSQILIIVVSTAVRMGGIGVMNELKIRDLRTKHVQTELKLLKSQINPHFLFNTLNNLYVMAGKGSDTRTAEGISGLAQMMRYVLYETDTDLISLSKEADQISRFIELQKLRFADDDDVTIEYTFDENEVDVSLPPMLLIPFVENAFKHSVSLQQPTVIEIELSANSDQVAFMVRNTVNRIRQKDEDTVSLGLNNVKRRLELLYPEAHELTIAEDETMFSINLTIQLRKNRS